MKILLLVARLLLGLIFLVFGLNGFLNFMGGPMPGGTAGAFVGALMSSHYVYLVAGTQVVSGAFLLVNRFVPLALALLAPMIANILVFHLTMAPGSIGPGVVTAILWLVLASRLRAHFAPLFVAKVELT